MQMYNNVYANVGLSEFAYARGVKNFNKQIFSSKHTYLRTWLSSANRLRLHFH